MFLNFIMNLFTNIMSFCVKLCELLYLPIGTHTYEFLLNMEHDIFIEYYWVLLCIYCTSMHRYKDI